MSGHGKKMRQKRLPWHPVGSFTLPRAASGFTLLEVLVAMAIMALLSLSAYQVLQGVLTSDQVGGERLHKLQALQRTMLRLDQDFNQLVGRAVRIEGEADPRLVRSGNYLYDSDSQAIGLVHLGWSNPLSRLPRSSLQRVIYRVKEEQLERGNFLYPDPVIGAQPNYQILMEGVTGMRLRYYAEGGWHDSWENAQQLPQGIEVTLETRDFGEVRRVFALVTAFGQEAAEEDAS